LAKLVSGWLPPWLHHKIFFKKNPGHHSAKIHPKKKKKLSKTLKNHLIFKKLFFFLTKFGHSKVEGDLNWTNNYL
jgi:hypothetical protein